LVVGFFIFRKVTTCLLKTVIGVIVIAVIAFVYYMFFK
ncbi:MAG TPA: sulfate transporter, partial [Prevotella sp.]|nr:sulfate transporter [Prevotella sp.]